MIKLERNNHFPLVLVDVDLSLTGPFVGNICSSSIRKPLFR